MATPPKKHQLGILLVHGIGTQPLGESLMRWGDALLKTIGEATRDQVRVKVDTAVLKEDEDGDAPASAVVSLRFGTEEKSWLLADGWWADAFLPPSYKELVSWSVRALPWAIALHVAHSFWQLDEQQGRRKLFATAIVIAKLLAALILAPLFVVVLALTLLLGVLPIPQIRSLMLAAQGTLVATVGDSLAFVESPVRAALIRTQILKDIRWLKARCEKTVIVAHSQGAAVVLDALGAIGDCMEDAPSPSQKEPPNPDVPDTLVTFGAGTNQLTSLKKLATGMPKRFGFNPVNIAMSALLISCAIFGWLGASVMQHQTTFARIFLAAGAVGIGIALSGGLGYLGKKTIAGLGKRFIFIEQRKVKIALGCIGVFLPVAMALIYFAAKQTQLPLMAVSLLCLDLLYLLLSTYLVLSKDMKKAVTIVTMPPNLDRWFDFYASHDPVPNGRTRIAPPEPAPDKFNSRCLCNERSFLADHTTYWENRDGFVLRVVRACARTAESAWQNHLPREDDAVDERATWRVRCLQFARTLSLIFWTALGLGLWVWHSADVPQPFTLPAWLPAMTGPLARLAVLAAGLGLAARCTSALLHFIWKLWRSHEHAAALKNKPSDIPNELPFMILALLYSTVLLLAIRAVTNTWEHFTDVSELGESCFKVIVAAIVFTAMQLHFSNPAPEKKPDATPSAATPPPG